MKRICVFCGSSPGAHADYLAAAGDLGRELTERGWSLVYGGASVGLMGHIADSVLSRGGEVIGVIPESLEKKEIAHPGLSELHIVDSMHERKALMADLSDGFVALPGGLGTLEELFEMLTWSQLGFHTKPSGLLNIRGYYEKLLAFLDHTVSERFVGAEHRGYILSDSEPAALLDAMVASARKRPTQSKWLDR